MRNQISCIWQKASLCDFAFYFSCVVIFLLQCDAGAGNVASTYPTVNILSEHSDGLVLEVLTPYFTTETVALRGQTFQRLVTPGDSPLTLQTEFQLPVKDIYIAVPPTGQVQLSIEASNAETFHNFRLAPSTRNIDATSHEDIEIAPDIERKRTFATMKSSPATFSPEKLAVLNIVGFLRDVRVAVVHAYPFQYNPQQQKMRFYRRILLRVTFETAQLSTGNSRHSILAAPPNLRADAHVGYHSLYRNLLINPPVVKGQQQSAGIHGNDFAATSHTTYPGLQSAPAVPSGPAVKIVVDEDGLHHITAKDLLEKGIDLSSISPNTMKLTNKGKEIPIFVAGERDGRFGREDFIEFWGKFNRGTYSLYGEYTKDNVYWLSWGQGKGARVGFLDVTPQKGVVPQNGGTIQPSSFQTIAHFEEDKFRGSLGYVDDKRDIWFWDNVKNGKPFVHKFELPPLSARGTERESKVQVMLHSRTLSEHHLRLSLNDVVLGEVKFRGQKKYLFDQLSHSLLRSGENTLIVESLLSEEISQVYLNWFSLEYWRTFQAVDGFLSFSLQTPGTYHMKLSGFQRKDISIYKASLSQLIGYQIETDDAGKFTLTFSGKIVQPTTYVTLSTNHKKKPKEIILDTPSDLRSPLNGADYLIIVYDGFYESVLPLAKHRSKKYRTAVVKVSDIYDEFSFGLLSPEAIRDFLRYTYHHWRIKPTYVLLVGDATWNFKKGKNYVPSYYFTSFKWGQAASDHLYACVNGDDLLPDLYIGRLTPRTKEVTRAVIEKILRYEQEEDFGPWRRELLMLAAKGSFVKDSEQLLKDFVPATKGYSVSRVYTGKSSKHYGTTEALLDFWNEGVSFIHFTGHGGGNIWADDKLFGFGDIPRLLNDQPSFVTSFTCFTGIFDAPGGGGLNEALVNKSEGGAIAAFGSTGLGWLRGDYYLEQALFSVLFENRTRQLGPAIAEAKITLLATRPHLVDMVRLYNLIGDPACYLSLPQQEIALTTLPAKPGAKEITVRASSASFSEGQALLWGVDQENTPIAEPVQILLQEGKFQAKIPFNVTPAQISNSKENLPLTFRSYAWNEEEGIDATGAMLFFLPGEDDIDLTVFTDDITLESTERTNSGASSATTHLSAIVINLGQKTAINVLVHFWADGRFLGEITIPGIAGGQSVKAEISFSPQTEASAVLVRVDPKNTIKEINEINNIAERRLTFHTFLLTRERGSAGKVASLDGNLMVEIPPLAVSVPSTLFIEAVFPAKVERQPQLFYIPLLKNPAGAIYSLSLIEGASPAQTFSATLTFLYNGNASQKVDGEPGIYRQNEETELWEKQPTKIVTAQTVEATVERLGKFALFSTTDNLAPEIQLTITDELHQQQKEVVSTTPTLTATVEDANGVGEIRVELNGEEISKDELVFSHNLSRVNASVVNLTPTLSSGNYTWKVIASDLTGNQVEEELSFRVTEEMLLSIANHPNPFEQETIFTYVLTQVALSVVIKIYPSSGRLIALLEDAPARQGYNEILWDGTDREGEEVANGIYFYHFIITTEEEGKFKKMGKLAKIR